MMLARRIVTPSNVMETVGCAMVIVNGASGTVELNHAFPLDLSSDKR